MESLAAYAAEVPKKAKPVVTAPSGRVALAPENPTWEIVSLDGTMYRDSVSLKEIELPFAAIVQGTVVEVLSTVKVMSVTTEPLSDEAPPPKYARPVYVRRYTMPEGKYVPST